MDLVHVNGKTYLDVSFGFSSVSPTRLTSSSIESSATTLALEMLSLLMGYQDLQIIEIAFTCQIVSPALNWEDLSPYSNNKKGVPVSPRYRDGHASSCRQPC